MPELVDLPRKIKFNNRLLCVGIYILIKLPSNSDHDLPPQNTVIKKVLLMRISWKKEDLKTTLCSKSYATYSSEWQSPTLQSTELKLVLGLQAKWLISYPLNSSSKPPVEYCILIVVLVTHDKIAQNYTHRLKWYLNKPWFWYITWFWFQFLSFDT